jgi:hypothetical protein
MGIKITEKDVKVIIRYTTVYLCNTEYFLNKKISIARFVGRRITSPKINTKRARRIVRYLVKELGFGGREVCYPFVHANESARRTSQFNRRFMHKLIEQRLKSGKDKCLPCGSARHRRTGKVGDYVATGIEYCVDSIVEKLGKPVRKFKRNFKFADAAFGILYTITHERTHVLQTANYSSYNDSLSYDERLAENEARLMFAEYLLILTTVGNSTEAMRIWDMRHMFTCKMYWGYKVESNDAYLKQHADEWFPIYWKIYCRKQNVPCTIVSIERFTREYKDSETLTKLLTKHTTDIHLTRKRKWLS